MPVTRPALILALFLAGCGGPYPSLAPTAQLLEDPAAPDASPTASPETTAQTNAALAARGAALAAQAQTLRAEPGIDPAALPVPAVPPAD